MFKGIIEATGMVRGVEDLETTRRFRIETPELAPELADGDSVAVDGACLTVVETGPDWFSVDVIGTTLDRTVSGEYRDGTRVNLERAMRMDGRVDGHLLQGHVDGTGHLIQNVRHGEFWLMDFCVPPDVAALTVEHGSLALNGVSLTVSEILPDDGCRIGIIPFTHAQTNLGDLHPGSPVNVEGDMIGKYVAKVLEARGHATGPSS